MSLTMLGDLTHQLDQRRGACAVIAIDSSVIVDLLSNEPAAAEGAEASLRQSRFA